MAHRILSHLHVLADESGVIAATLRLLQGICASENSAHIQTMLDAGMLFDVRNQFHLTGRPGNNRVEAFQLLEIVSRGQPAQIQAILDRNYLSFLTAAVTSYESSDVKFLAGATLGNIITLGTPAQIRALVCLDTVPSMCAWLSAPTSESLINRSFAMLEPVLGLGAADAVEEGDNAHADYVAQCGGALQLVKLAETHESKQVREKAAEILKNSGCRLMQIMYENIVLSEELSA